jgi:hypothetical protein
MPRQGTCIKNGQTMFETPDKSPRSKKILRSRSVSHIFATERLLI